MMQCILWVSLCDGNKEQATDEWKTRNKNVAKDKTVPSDPQTNGKVMAKNEFGLFEMRALCPRMLHVHAIVKFARTLSIHVPFHRSLCPIHIIRGNSDFQAIW